MYALPTACRGCRWSRPRSPPAAAGAGCLTRKGMGWIRLRFVIKCIDTMNAIYVHNIDQPTNQPINPTTTTTTNHSTRTHARAPSLVSSTRSPISANPFCFRWLCVQVCIVVIFIVIVVLSFNHTYPHTPHTHIISPTIHGHPQTHPHPHTPRHPHTYTPVSPAREGLLLHLHPRALARLVHLLYPYVSISGGVWVWV